MGKAPAKFAIALRPRASGLLRPRAAALRIEHKEIGVREARRARRQHGWWRMRAYRTKS